jgi:UDP-N-acetyl-D-mannosaminuronate dehydrogenase
MKQVLIVGLGEIGGTIFSILKESKNFNIFGLDLDKKKMEEYSAKPPPKSFELKLSIKSNDNTIKTASIDVLQICVPAPSKEKFVENTKSYIQKYKPKLTIINSTVPIGSTIELQKRCGGLIAHSPCRGVHKNREYMKQEFKRWTKYVGGATPEAGLAAKKHFELAGLKTKMLPSCNDTEFAKLFETTYRTWMIVFFQKMHRLARTYSFNNSNIRIDFDEVVDFIEDTHRARHDRPVMFPGEIGGHCLLPNSKLLLSEHEPEMLNIILQSNAKRIEEMKDPEIATETKKVLKRVSISEADQDKEVMGKST